MIENKKEFNSGLVLMVCFWAVFVLLLSPVFPGQGQSVNFLDYMDSMYNSISKKSAYYIPAIQRDAKSYEGNSITVNIKTDANLPPERVTSLMQHAGMKVEPADKEIKVIGDMGGMVSAILGDADTMYLNDGKAISSKYGSNEKQVMYDWYNILKSMEKKLTKQKNFKESKMLYQVRTKAVEPAYNYYGIEAQSIQDKAILVILSLAGYVIYTVWFGFSILFMFEGWGLKLKH